MATAALLNAKSTSVSTLATHAAIYTTATTSTTPGTEVAGGTPAYARMPITWSAPVNGVMSATITFNVPAGTTVIGAGLLTALVAGTYLDGGPVTSQTFATQGTYPLTITRTES